MRVITCHRSDAWRRRGIPTSSSIRQLLGCVRQSVLAQQKWSRGLVLNSLKRVASKHWCTLPACIRAWKPWHEFLCVSQPWCTFLSVYSCITILMLVFSVYSCIIILMCVSRVYSSVTILMNISVLFLVYTHCDTHTPRHRCFYPQHYICSARDISSPWRISLFVRPVVRSLSNTNCAVHKYSWSHWSKIKIYLIVCKKL